MAIVCWGALPAVFPQAGKNVGGAETRIWTLAQALQARGDLRIALAMRSPGGRFPKCHHGIELWLQPDRFATARRFVSEHLDLAPRPRLKRFHPRLLYLVPWLLATRPLRRRDPLPMQPDERLRHRRPDLWVALGITEETSRTVATAQAQGRPSLVFIQSNADLDERLAIEETFVSRWGDAAAPRRYVLRHATQIVCQTQWQLEALQTRFGRQGIIVRNPIEIDRWRLPAPDQPPYALWIGRYDDFHKRPLLMLRAAAACPDIAFKLVINRGAPEIEQQVRRLRPANVEIIDYVPFDQMPRWFAAARLFVSTGSPQCEGFPNVLLQAAASRTPIVSLEDFDLFLARSRAGVSCDGSLERLITAIKTGWQQPSVDPPAVDAYLRQHHDHAQVAAAVHAIITRLLAQQPATAPPRSS